MANLERALKLAKEAENVIRRVNIELGQLKTITVKEYDQLQEAFNNWEDVVATLNEIDVEEAADDEN